MAKEIILDVIVNAGKAPDTLGKLEQSVKDLKKEIKGVEIGSAEFDTLQQKFAESNSQLTELNKSLKTLKTEIPTDSLAGMEANLKRLKDELKNVEVGSEQFKKLKGEVIQADTKIKNLNKSIEGLDTEAMAGEIGKFAGGVGSIFTAVQAVIGNTSEEFEQFIKNVATGMAVVQGIKGATELWTSAQKMLNIAMAANPIGLIVASIAALVVGIALLVNYMTTLNESTDDMIMNSKAYADALDKAAASGAEQLVSLGLLTQGTQEYKDKLRELVIQYQDYLTVGEEARLLNANLAEATDLVTLAIERQAKSEATKQLLIEATKEQIKLEREYAQTIKDGGYFTPRQKVWAKEDIEEAKENVKKLSKELQTQVKDINKNLKIKPTVEKVDPSKVLSDAKSNASKAVAFEENLSKQIAALRISLVRDEYEQKRKAIELNYKDEKNNLQDLIADNEKLKKIIAEKLIVINTNITANEKDLITAKATLSTAQLLEKTYQTKLANEKAAGKINQQTVNDLSQQQQIIKEESDLIYQINKALGEDRVTVKEIKNEQNLANDALAKSTKLIETKKALELQILDVTRLIKTEQDAITANADLQTKIRQINVDLITDELAKAKAQIELNKQIELERIAALEKEAIARKAILDAVKDTAELDSQKYKDAKAANDLLLGTKDDIGDLAKYREQVGKKAAQDIAKAEKDASKDSTKSQAEDVKDLAELKKEIIKRITGYEIENAREYSDKKLQLQKAALDVEMNVELTELKSLYDAKLITTEEYEKDKAVLEERYRQKKYDLDQQQIEQWRTKANEASAAVFEVANAQSQARFENEMNRMSVQYEEQAQGFDDALKAEAITQEEYDIAMKALDKKAQDDDLAMRKRQAEYEKKMALTQIAINTAVAISKAWTSGPGAPAIIAGILFSAGLQAAVVNSQPIPEFAKGTIVGGVGGGTEDNITAKLSPGESVINAKSTAMFKPLLSSINQAGGGISFDNANIGGTSSMGVSISQDDIAAIVNGINDKQVINVATDTDKVVRKVRNIEAKARF